MPSRYGAPAALLQAGDLVVIDLAGLPVSGRVLWAENAGLAGAPEWIAVLRLPAGGRWVWDQRRMGGEVYHQKNSRAERMLA